MTLPKNKYIKILILLKVSFFLLFPLPSKTSTYSHCFPSCDDMILLLGSGTAGRTPGPLLGLCCDIRLNPQVSCPPIGQGAVGFPLNVQILPVSSIWQRHRPLLFIGDIHNTA
jgi:hypothetical protein